MNPAEPFPCIMIRRGEGGAARFGVERIRIDDLPPGEVLIQVACSSLNYKDALACQAHPGVVRTLPHVPGIDCAGHVVAVPAESDFLPGEPVLVTGYDLGAPAWGGLAEFVRVPAAWVVSLPGGLTLEEAMTYGTAGFTAAQCVTAIVDRGIGPDRGDVVVTGATGGVGSVAVAILAKLGYRVAAVTGKPEQAEWLHGLGAAELLSREQAADASDRPLLGERWAAAVDTVGGVTLAALVRNMKHRGVVTACGLVGGVDVPLTVYPFILRGVTLAGIDSAKCPREPRLEMWSKLAGPWKVDQLAALRREITLDEVPAEIARMLAGQSHGRVVVRPTSLAT
ncbi:MAG: YhdH/YhfP family quinone oxidoreductase [Pirellulales bacterium]|nr:YhdH/YhfP family quinone oxidoreductase [Pirellulales bacterium]